MSGLGGPAIADERRRPRWTLCRLPVLARDRQRATRRPASGAAINGTFVTFHDPAFVITATGGTRPARAAVEAGLDAAQPLDAATFGGARTFAFTS